ncbi:MAG: dephospho-CoA kinase [bacterium]|nr:dephospho-CoA kinase [bacterium]
MFIVGLTGGIASGKSTVARILRELGATVLDADLAAREVAVEALPELVEAFGEDVRGPGGSLDRARLATLIFTDPQARQRLNQITHPRILRRLAGELGRLEREGVAIVVVEAALLVDAGLTGLVDEVWVVAADPDRQVARLAERDRLTGDEAAGRLEAQLPLAEKLRAAHVVIDNDGTLARTRCQVEASWARVCGTRPRGVAMARWTDLGT